MPRLKVLTDVWKMAIKTPVKTGSLWTSFCRWQASQRLGVPGAKPLARASARMPKCALALPQCHVKIAAGKRSLPRRPPRPGRAPEEPKANPNDTASKVNSSRRSLTKSYVNLPGASLRQGLFLKPPIDMRETSPWRTLNKTPCDFSNRL